MKVDKEQLTYNAEVLSRSTSLDTNPPPNHLSLHKESLLTAQDYDVKNDEAALIVDLERCSTVMRGGRKPSQREQLALRNTAKSAAQFLRQVFSIVTKTFLADIKNPCWYSNVSHTAASNKYLLETLRPGVGKGIPRHSLTRLSQLTLGSTSEKTLLCMPYFFISGFPKSATTFLDAGIRRHPQVVGPTDKEPHWWTRGLHFKDNLQDNGPLSVVRYSLFFKPIADTLDAASITYDASQSTLWDSPYPGDHCSVPALLSRILPEAKFVVLMRNPVDRLLSHFIWSCKYRHGDDTSKWPTEVVHDGPNAFHNQVVWITNWFNNCLKSFSLFECANSRDFRSMGRGDVCGTIGHRLLIGIYFIHLEKWLQFYSKEQFLFLRMEDFVTNPFKTLKQLTRFLVISPATRDEADLWFSKEVNVRGHNGFHIENRTVDILELFYRPYNTLLAELLTDDRYLWNS